MSAKKDDSQRFVKMTNHGMINIPAPLRKKYGFKDGDEVLVMDDVDGFIKIYPVATIEEIRKHSFKSKDLLKELEESRTEELELEKE